LAIRHHAAFLNTLLALVAALPFFVAKLHHRRAVVKKTTEIINLKN
jgi:hypothetical protein